MNKYSVLMSVYNKDVPKDLIQSIDSMLKQTVPTDQFVLVIDGPINKELKKVVCNYVRVYPDLFMVIPLKKNHGLGRALDIGLKQCKNELVARMDADDISLPNRCEKLLNLFNANPSLGLAGTNIDEFYEDSSHIVSSRVVPSKYIDICKFMRRRSPFNHPTVMFKKSEVLRCGGYGKMRRKQDLDLFARMINNNVYALNINESLLLFRSNKDNYKRRKSWEYCKSYMYVQWVNFKRGYCSVLDLVIVCSGQLFMHFAPMGIMKLISDKFLRKEKKHE